MNTNNTVELIGHYGSDELHACSAWTSTSREITDEKRNRIPQLLKMLAEAGHHTPFEKSSIHFLVDCDIASHIHLLKHRIGVSINAESARYKELKEDKYYIPEDWKGIKNKKWVTAFCNYDYEHIEPNETTWSSILEQYTNIGNELYHQCIADLEPVLGRKRAKESARYKELKEDKYIVPDDWDDYWQKKLAYYTQQGNELYHQCVGELTDVLGRKRAKESARFFKTYNSKITSDVMFNWRSFYHFQGLRNKPEAQKEIREIAQMMLDSVKMIPGNPFEHTIAAFGL